MEYNIDLNKFYILINFSYDNFNVILFIYSERKLEIKSHDNNKYFITAIVQCARIYEKFEFQLVYLKHFKIN